MEQSTIFILITSLLLINFFIKEITTASIQDRIILIISRLRPSPLFEKLIKLKHEQHEIKLERNLISAQDRSDELTRHSRIHTNPNPRRKNLNITSTTSTNLKKSISTPKLNKRQQFQLQKELNSSPLLTKSSDEDDEGVTIEPPPLLKPKTNKSEINLSTRNLTSNINSNSKSSSFINALATAASQELQNLKERETEPDSNTNTNSNSEQQAALSLIATNSNSDIQYVKSLPSLSQYFTSAPISNINSNSNINIALNFNSNLPSIQNITPVQSTTSFNPPSSSTFSRSIWNILKVMVEYIDKPNDFVKNREYIQQLTKVLNPSLVVSGEDSNSIDIVAISRLSQGFNQNKNYNAHKVDIHGLSKIDH